MGTVSPLTDEYLDAFFTVAPAALALLDRELRLVKVNDLVPAMSGLPPERILGSTVRDIVPGMADGLEPLLETVLASGEPVLHHRIAGETPARPGVRRQWTVSVFPVPAGAGEPRGIGLVAVEDPEPSWWVEGTTHGMYSSTLDGRFVRVSPALVKMLGYESEAELLRLSLPEDVYVDPAQRRRLVEHYARKREIRGVEVEWRRKDGRPIVVRLSGRPLTGEGDALTGFAMIAEDVTEQQHLTRQLAHAQKMETIGQLTSGIAHDFNNLLTVILAHARFIADGLAGLPALEDVREDLHALQVAARQGADLTHKILALSRTEALEPRPFDLAPAVEDVLATLRRMLPTNIELRVSVAGPVAVHADPGALHQIVLNLATNARDAMPEGGTLHVAVRLETLREEDQRLHEWLVPGRYGCLEVTDSGTGMDARTLTHVFEPFFTTKPAGVGTGLGLAMVYNLVKQQNGFVLLASEPAAGTTAKIYLPLAEEATAEDAEAGAREDAHGRGEGGGERLLLLEDDRLLRRVAERLLARAGYQVRSAPDAHAGLAIYEADPAAVDLIVTDFMMPGKDGVQLYEELRRQGRTVKVLFTSGYAAQRLRELAERDPRVGVITKPWTTAELLRAVRGVLDR
jgi:two-component system cell cycle sensor histidine kinase/response regulator CckA